MSNKHIFSVTCAHAINAATPGAKQFVDIPPGLALDTARNYAYSTRKTMQMEDRVHITIVNKQLQFTLRESVADLAVMPVAKLEPEKTPGLAVLVGEVNQTIIDACKVLLDFGCVHAVELTGADTDKVALLAEKHGLIVSKCARGVLLT